MIRLQRYPSSLPGGVGQQINSELAKQVEHVNEHPVLGEPVTFAAPEIQAVDADPPTRGRAIQVPAGMCGQHAIPASTASVSALGEQAVQILYSPIGEGVQPVFLVQVFKFR